MDRGTSETAVGRLLAARALKDLAKTLPQSNAASVSGLWGSSVAATAAAVSDELKRPAVVICGHLDEADDLADDLELFTGKRPDVLQALELTATLGRMSEEQVSNRLQLVSRYASGGQANFLVAPIHALMQAVPAKSELNQVIRTL